MNLSRRLVFRLRQRKDLSTLKLLAQHPERTLEFAGNGLRLALFGLTKHPLSALGLRNPGPSMTGVTPRPTRS